MCIFLFVGNVRAICQMRSELRFSYTAAIVIVCAGDNSSCRNSSSSSKQRARDLQSSAYLEIRSLRVHFLGADFLRPEAFRPHYQMYGSSRKLAKGPDRRGSWGASRHVKVTRRSRLMAEEGDYHYLANTLLPDAIYALGWKSLIF